MVCIAFHLVGRVDFGGGVCGVRAGGASGDTKMATRSSGCGYASRGIGGE